LCNATIGCSRGYCGPYYLHREYWRDAGQVVLQDDDPDRDQAFVDCAVDAACAQKVVENYMMKWGRVSVVPSRCRRTGAGLEFSVAPVRTNSANNVPQSKTKKTRPLIRAEKSSRLFSARV